MRLFVTILLALILSWLGGSAAALLLAEWARGDESFILAFMAIPLVGLVALAVFLVAATRPVPARALNSAAAAMMGVLALILAGLSVLELFVNGTLASAWRGVQLLIGIVGSGAAIILIQWAVFRWRSRAAPPAMLFGRGPGVSA